MVKPFFILSKSLDVWDNNTALPYEIRASVSGISPIGGICSSSRYSIIEYVALISIQNAAHELGHK